MTNQPKHNKLPKKSKPFNHKSAMKKRIVLIGTLFSISVCGMLYKVWDIKLNKGDDYQRQVLDLMINKESEITPQRGSILDRNSQTLVNSILTYNIILDPFAILSSSEETQLKVIKTLSSTLEKDANDIYKELNKNPNSRYLLLNKSTPTSIVASLKEEGLKGVWYEETYTRNYPKETFAAQVLGFYSKSGTGQYGIEQQFEELLAGTSGRIFSQMQEEQIVTTELTPATQGSSVVLTIDSVIQEYIEKGMQPYIDEYKPLNATALLMNPNTGEILGMYSYPSFNPSTYTTVEEQVGSNVWGNASDVERSAMVSTAWKNHTMQYTYEPGSTFKPLVMGAALDEGLIQPDEHFYCKGWNKVGIHTIHCWKRGGHGDQTLEEALANSCNVVMMQIAERMDSSMFEEYMDRYGLGSPTGIELPGEETGLLHSKLSQVDKATHSMGQGFTLTPVQLTSAFSALLNGGTLYQPQIVSKILNPDGSILKEYQPTIRRTVLSNETAAIISKMLKSVVASGTGKDAGVDGYEIGGKTGTAQKLPRSAGKYVISFIGFAPIENPQVVGLITFDEVPDTSGLPKKAFSDIMTNVLPYLSVSTQSNTITSSNDNLKSVPNLIGKNIYEAYSTLQTHNFNYELVGVGTIIAKQYPEEATCIPEGSTIKLFTESSNIDSLVIVPNLIGLTQSEAEKVIGSNFVLKGSTTGIITSQFPRAGTKIEKGQSISIKGKETSVRIAPAE